MGPRDGNLRCRGGDLRDRDGDLRCPESGRRHRAGEFGSPEEPNEFANEPVRGWTGSIDGEVVILGAGDTVLLRGCEQDSTGTFDDGPITTHPAAATSANPSVTVTTASLVEVVARVILSSGSQFDSTTGGVTANHAYGT